MTKDIYLRMRILTDAEEKNPCANMYADGNINDFAVRIVREKVSEPEPIPQPKPTPGPISAPSTPSNETKNYVGRVGINTDTPKTTLHIKELPFGQPPARQPQGALFPSFTNEEREKFQNVAEGTMIYNSTLKCLEIYKGNKLKWQCMNK